MRNSGMMTRRTVMVAGSAAMALHMVGKPVSAQDGESSFRGTYSGIFVTWGEDWTKRDARSGSDFDYVLLNASAGNGGTISVQINAIDDAWGTVEQAEDAALDSWIATFNGAKTIDEMLHTWTSDEAVGFLFREDWSGELSVRFVEYARRDGSEIWYMTMVQAEGMDDDDVERLLQEIEVDDGAVLISADLDDIAEELVEATEGE